MGPAHCGHRSYYKTAVLQDKALKDTTIKNICSTAISPEKNLKKVKCEKNEYRPLFFNKRGLKQGRGYIQISNDLEKLIQMSSRQNRECWSV